MTPRRPRMVQAWTDAATPAAAAALDARMHTIPTTDAAPRRRRAGPTAAWPALLVLPTLLALPTAPALAQQPPDATAPAAVDPALEELAQRVAKAHRTGAGAAAVTAFRADLRIRNVARDDPQRGEVELAVRFLQWQSPERPRPVPLIRYRQIDSARTLEFGRDRTYFWALVDGALVDLTTKELEADRDSVRRNLKLAQQMVRFLEPAEVVRALRDPGPVERGRLELGRARPPTDVTTVSGWLPDFPLRQSAGEQTKVRLQVHFDADDRLFALQAVPFDGGSDAVGEFLLFRDYAELEGRMVPKEVRHYAVTADGSRHQQMIVQITTLDLDPGYGVDDLDRPK